MNRNEFLLQVDTAAKRSSLFPLGELSITRSAFERLEALGLEAVQLVARHHTGDWGDVDGADIAINEESLHEKQRFFSSYEIEQERFWVLTTADRSRTIVFLPGDAVPDPPPTDPSLQGARTASGN